MNFSIPCRSNSVIIVHERVHRSPSFSVFHEVVNDVGNNDNITCREKEYDIDP